MFYININQYYKGQKNEFKEFARNENRLMLIAAEDVNDLDKFAEMTEGERTEYIDDNSHIITYPNEKGVFGRPTVHLYIKGTFKDYRPRFEQFLIEHYEFDSNFNLPKIEHVDHLLNKTRVKECFIRMILLPGNINTAWGRSYERIVTNLEKSKVYKNMYLLDYVLLLKATGLAFFKKKDIPRNNNGISAAASKTLQRYQSVFNLKLDQGKKDTLLTYFRAEINYMVRKRFYDHQHIGQINKELDKVQVLKHLKSVLGDLTYGAPVYLDNHSTKSPSLDNDKYKCSNITDCHNLNALLNNPNQTFEACTVHAVLDPQTYKGHLKIKIEYGCSDKFVYAEGFFKIAIEPD
ncbi:hypothetical protein P4639_28525 [Priestia megaterium]|uniref:hypothetical protein n=1 Tax=Priestia megaterium TaxID=1404 RepID=UPI002E23DCDE|nr:hypothetical protein [Priestia megaterium]